MDARKKYSKFLVKKEEDEKPKNQCPSCAGSDVVQIGLEILCATCHVVLDEMLSDKVSYESGDGDSSSTIINDLAPTMSTRTYVTGFANKMIKQMMIWNSFSYREKVALDIYNYIVQKCQVYEKYRAIKLNVSRFRGAASALMLEKQNSPQTFEKKADQLIGKYRLRVWQINKEIISNAVKLFKLLMDLIITRIPVKYGVIACCYYFACKEFYIILSRPELCIIFDTDLENVTKGFNKVNLQARKYADFQKCINRRPLKFEDYTEKLQWTFPELDEQKMRTFRVFLDRISGEMIAKKYTPPSIIGGLLNNCSKVYKFGITSADIISRLYISNSTLNKYTKITRAYVYKLENS